MNKTASTSQPIHALLAERWSPRAFTDEPVPPGALASLFEAVRWAPSCFNEQPWTFLVATRADAAGHERLASCLTEGNAWARKAPVLVLGVTRTHFARNDRPNRHAWHDVGLAVMSLMVQATAMELSVHAMAGFDPAAARERCDLPAGCEPVVMLALGRRGDPETLPEKLALRETAPRERKPLTEVVRGAGWGAPAPL